MGDQLWAFPGPGKRAAGVERSPDASDHPGRWGPWAARQDWIEVGCLRAFGYTPNRAALGSRSPDAPREIGPYANSPEGNTGVGLGIRPAVDQTPSRPI
jgi:hypothetical protein